ncbi:MAG: hypothetical protein KAR06_06495 [Deltaproteobacteria bacterium]|nr:hypothetical protein [Deltaproteobacteria bacterium]
MAKKTDPDKIAVFEAIIKQSGKPISFDADREAEITFMVSAQDKEEMIKFLRMEGDNYIVTIQEKLLGQEKKK